MQDKQKVTLYLPPDLHRQLKIRGAVEGEPMSDIAQRAIAFYLTHPHLVDEIEARHGNTHRIYECPECATQLIIKEGEAEALHQAASILPEGLPLEVAPDITHADSQDGELISC